MIDRKRLAEEADGETVARFLGIDMKRKGRYTYIRCPGHLSRLGKPDNNLGNAIIQKKGYYCYACGTFVATHNMLTEYEGCSPEKAYEIMAEAMGGISLYDNASSSTGTALPKYRLTAAEAKLIGLCSDWSVTIKNGSQTAHEGLYCLYRRDPGLYYGMILAKAKESLERYEYCLKHYASPEADMAGEVCNLLGQEFEYAVYGKIQREFEKRIEKCRKLVAIFGSAARKTG